MSRLLNGLFVTQEDQSKFYFAIINGTLTQITPDDALIEGLSPGYYDANLEKVPTDQAVGGSASSKSIPRARSRRSMSGG